VLTPVEVEAVARCAGEEPLPAIIVTAKAMMGHQNVETTMIYVHHVPQHDAAAKLSAALRTEATPQQLATTGSA